MTVDSDSKVEVKVKARSRDYDIYFFKPSIESFVNVNCHLSCDVRFKSHTHTPTAMGFSGV